MPCMQQQQQFFAWKYVTISTDCQVQKQNTYMNLQVVDEVAILDDPELDLLLHLLSKVTRHICFWHF